jgi:polyferredoxin
MREKRAFCRYICPLGLILGFFNRISLLQIKLNQNKCISCSACKKHCPMGIDPVKEVNSIECIKCGDCVRVCPVNTKK